MTRDEIFAASDSTIVAVDVPEWGGQVHLRSLTGAELDSFDKECYDHQFVNVRSRLLVRSICDETGRRLLSDDDHEALSARSARVIDLLYAKAKSLSRIDDRGDAEKN